MTIGRIDERVSHCHTLTPVEQGLPENISTDYVTCHGPWGYAITLADSIRDLADKNRALGICLSYPDLFGSGQEARELPDHQLEGVIVTQLALVAALAKIAGTRLSTVKCHGDLLSDVEYDERIAQVVARAIYKFDPSIILICAAASTGVRVVRDCGIVVVHHTSLG